LKTAGSPRACSLSSPSAEPDEKRELNASDDGARASIRSSDVSGRDAAPVVTTETGGFGGRHRSAPVHALERRGRRNSRLCGMDAAS
jgi:hypothetical protein